MQMPGIVTGPNPFRNGIKTDNVFDLASQFGSAMGKSMAIPSSTV